MTAFTPPVLSAIQARFHAFDQPLQKRLYKFMRPLDQPVNVFVNSDGSVTTDYVVPILATSQNGEATQSTVLVLYPWQPGDSKLDGPPEGAESGPWKQPPPYATTDYSGTGQAVHTRYVQPVWIRYWFRGGCHYPSISANLVTLLTNAGFANYLV